MRSRHDHAPKSARMPGIRELPKIKRNLELAGDRKFELLDEAVLVAVGLWSKAGICRGKEPKT